jgi:hypothetical protein
MTRELLLTRVFLAAVALAPGFVCAETFTP